MLRYECKSVYTSIHSNCTFCITNVGSTNTVSMHEISFNALYQSPFQDLSCHFCVFASVLRDKD